MTNHKMPLPNTVLTFKLLDRAKLSEDERKLALIFGNNLEFETMKLALQRIFTKSTIANESFHDTNNIKQEEAFYNKNMSKSKQNKTSKSSKSQKVSNSNKHNPLDKNGKVSRCIICDSKMHWAYKFPRKSNYQSVNTSQEVSSDTKNESKSEEIHIVLMTEEIDKNEIFIAEASKLAVVDTACTKTVAGEEWYMNYIKDLPCELKNQIKSVESNTSFKFGDGHKVFSYKKVTLPADIAGINCFIDIELVKEKIPLLLSKSSLKKAKAVIVMANDKIIIFDKKIALYFSTSGHYCIDIYPRNREANNCEEVMILEKDLSDNEKKTQVIKIHKQFGHASIENIKKRINNAGFLHKDLNAITENVIQSSDTCIRFKKAPPKPVVGLSKAKDFNETISLDLHEINSEIYYFHTIDEFTRYSNVVIIKKKSSSLTAFIRNWLSIFGASKKLFSDNEGEFISDEFYEMCERFNIKVITTPSYSPWSNGLCERLNQFLTNMLGKIRDDVK